MRIFIAAGLPIPRVQATFDDDGRVIRVDFFFDEARLVIEVLGHRTHSTRRQLAADAERRAKLTLRGYEVVEFTYEHVRHRPDYVAATTATHLAARACA
jgi:very-short-patch-repair endonuclease